MTGANSQTSGSAKKAKPGWREFRVRLAVAGALILIAGAVIWHIRTDTGEIVVTVDDPGASFVVTRSGIVAVRSSELTWEGNVGRARLRSGALALTLNGKDAAAFEIVGSDDRRTQAFILQRGDEKSFIIHRRGPVAAK
jgi:hypothetical protein